MNAVYEPGSVLSTGDSHWRFLLSGGSLQEADMPISDAKAVGKVLQ